MQMAPIVYAKVKYKIIDTAKRRELTISVRLYLYGE